MESLTTLQLINAKARYIQSHLTNKPSIIVPCEGKAPCLLLEALADMQTKGPLLMGITHSTLNDSPVFIVTFSPPINSTSFNAHKTCISFVSYINENIKDCYPLESFKTSHLREDLKMIPSMIAAGWQPQFHADDKRNNRTTPQNVPHHPISFKKGFVLAWRDGYGTQMYWRVGDLLAGHCRNHRTYDTLQEVLDKEARILF